MGVLFEQILIVHFLASPPISTHPEEESCFTSKSRFQHLNSEVYPWICWVNLRDYVLTSILIEQKLSFSAGVNPGGWSPFLKIQKRYFIA